MTDRDQIHLREITRLQTQRDELREQLAAAVDALGDIAHSLYARQLAARDIHNDVLRAKIAADNKPDDALYEIASRGFEAGAIALAEAGHPGASVHTCNPTEEP